MSRRRITTGEQYAIAFVLSTVVSITAFVVAIALGAARGDVIPDTIDPITRAPMREDGRPIMFLLMGLCCIGSFAGPLLFLFWRAVSVRRSR
jgi:hypothetical protein